MGRCIYVFKLLITLSSTLFLSLSCIKISYIFLGINVNTSLTYTAILILYVALFIYLLLKYDIFTLYKGEPYLIVSTAIGLRNNSNPFYSVVIDKLKSFYGLFIKDFSIDCARLSIFIAIFFMSDKVITTNKPSNTGEYAATIKNGVSANISYNTQMPEKVYMDREIKKMLDIKDIIINGGKKENIMKKIDELQFIDSNAKSKLMEKVLDDKMKDAIDDLLYHTRNIKKNMENSKRINGMLENIETELLTFKSKVYDKKNNKKFKISVEYLQNWYGYEEVLKKYFNE